MKITRTTTKISASLCAVAALALAGPATASAGQEAMSPDEQYAYTCGHLGTPCDEATESEARPERKKVRRACSKRSRSSKSGRAHRSARKGARRCGARRAGARR